MATTPLEDLAHVIQLSVAPVFLLTAIGTILSVLSGRLGRVVDRSRVLRDRLEGAPKERQKSIHAELALLGRRRHLVNVAMTFGTITALLVCLLIALAFIGYIAHISIAIIIAVLFILAMASFVVALVSFLREVLLAASTVDSDAT
jgi:MFS family permease